MTDSSGADPTRRLRLFLLGILMVVGLALRLLNIDARIMDHDEAFSWRVATRPLGTMIRQVEGDTHPLFHFLIIKGLVLAGWSSLPALRAPSVVAGVATIGVVYGLSLAAIGYAARRDVGPVGRAGWAALAAATYIAIQPYHIAVSGTARMYSFAAFFAAASSWLLIKALGRPTPSWPSYLGYAITVALMLHSHNFGVFIFAAQVGFALVEGWRHRPDAGRLRHLAGAVALAGLLYSPWLPAFLAQAGRVREGFWIPPVTGDSLGEVLVNVTFGRDIIDRPTGVVLACLALVGLAWSTIGQRGVRPWMLPAQVVAVWAITILISTVGGRPILQERYLILASPAFAGWFAVAVARARPRSARALLLIILLSPTGYALVWNVSRPWRPPLSTYEAIEYLRRVGRPGDVLLVNRPGIVNTMRYYQSRIPGPTFDVRYVLEENELRRIGQASHLSSFNPDEAIRLDALEGFGASRLWVLNGACDLRGSSWVRRSDVAFGIDRGEIAAALQLVSYTRLSAAEQGRGRPATNDGAPAGPIW